MTVNNTDTFVISDSRTIAFDLVTSNAMDQIRVVTSATAVPEPGTAGLICMVISSLCSSSTPLNRQFSPSVQAGNMTRNGRENSTTL